MRQLLKIYLTSAGYATADVSDGESALSEVESDSSYHLVILDLMMPGMNGWEACREMRRIRPELPILMLTARTSIEDKVQGLTIGADDFLTKPFDGRELVARVQSLLRRTFGNESQPHHIESMHLTIDPDARMLFVHDSEVSLTPTEFDVLWLLAKRPGRTFAREEILERIWGHDFEGDVRAVDSHIKNIREKFREAGIQLEPIVTVWGVGYKFEANT